MSIERARLARCSAPIHENPGDYRPAFPRAIIDGDELFVNRVADVGASLTIVSIDDRYEQARRGCVTSPYLCSLKRYEHLETMVDNGRRCARRACVVISTSAPRSYRAQPVDHWLELLVRITPPIVASAPTFRRPSASRRPSAPSGPTLEPGSRTEHRRRLVSASARS